jgi:sugar phosphate permease
VSVLLPLYLAALGYPVPYVTLGVFLIVLGNVTLNLLLALIPFGDSLGLSAALLLARQSLSQMDVPTRQAFMADIFDEGERVRAFAVTNTFRSLAGLPGPLLVGAMLSSGLLAAPFVLSGAVKAGYDGSIYLLYRGRARVSQHK